MRPRLIESPTYEASTYEAPAHDAAAHEVFAEEPDEEAAAEPELPKAATGWDTAIDELIRAEAPDEGERPAREPAAPAEPSALNEPAPEPLAEAAAEPTAEPAASASTPAILGQYEANGARYTMYVDGSIDAETAHGVYRFASMEELKRFIEHSG